MEIRDYSELLGRMRSRGFTQARLAKSIGISETSMNLALNNKREFKQSEIQKICLALEIPFEEIAKYFFAKKLLKLEA